jgi:hypothetical protein
VVTECIRYLVAGQTTGKAEDPDGYVKTIAAILIRYPESVVRVVTHPAHGLPVQLDWLPKPSEVKRACEAEAAKQFAAVAPPVPRLLDPKRTPEEIARVDAKLREVRGEVLQASLVPPGERMRGRIDMERPAYEAAERALDAMKGQPLPKLSQRALETLGLGAYDRAPIPEAAE